MSEGREGEREGGRLAMRVCRRESGRKCTSSGRTCGGIGGEKGKMERKEWKGRGERRARAVVCSAVRRGARGMRAAAVSAGGRGGGGGGSKTAAAGSTNGVGGSNTAGPTAAATGPVGGTTSTTTTAVHVASLPRVETVVAAAAAKSTTVVAAAAGGAAGSTVEETGNALAVTTANGDMRSGASSSRSKAYSLSEYEAERGDGEPIVAPEPAASSSSSSSSSSSASLAEDNDTTTTGSAISNSSGFGVWTGTSILGIVLGRGWGGGPGGEERRKSAERLVTNLSALLLFGALAFAFFVTVDEERWRGWTAWEIFARIPLSNWERYCRNVVERPLLTKSIISGFVYSFGDLIAQKLEGASISELDVRRTARSGVLGLAFQAPIYHYYYELTEHVLPTENGLSSALAKVVLDQTAATAAWNALYYLIIGVMTSRPLDESTALIKKTAWPLLVNGWKLWPAAHIVTYTVIPIQHRLLWVDFVEIIWVVILSFTGSQMSKDDEKATDVVALAVDNPLDDDTAAAGSVSVSSAINDGEDSS